MAEVPYERRHPDKGTAFKHTLNVSLLGHERLHKEMETSRNGLSCAFSAGSAGEVDSSEGI